MKHQSIIRTVFPAPTGLLCALALGFATAISPVHADQGAPLVPGSQQNFEGGGLGFTLGGGFGSGGTTDYWEVIPNNGTRVDSTIITTGGVFANASPEEGSVLAGDDTNAGGTSPVTVTFNSVNVSGLANLSVEVLLAAVNTPSGSAVARGFEGTDDLKILVSYNSGAFQPLAAYEPDPSFGGGTNTFLSLDTNNDGLGDAGSATAATAIEQRFKNFSHPLTPANTVQIRIEAKGEATGEYIAIDNFRICGDVAVTDPPVLAGIEGSGINYAEGDPATQVTNTITVSDPDSTTLTGATVRITSNNTSGEDVLAGTSGGGVTVGTYNPATGTLPLSGTASLAAYQTALRSVTYRNANLTNPNIAQRTVSFQVTDDQSNNSNLQMRNINVANSIQTFSIPHTESFDDGLGTGNRFEVVGGFDVGLDDFFRRLPSGDAEFRFATPIEGVLGSGFFGGEDINQNGEPDGGKVVVCLNASGLGNLSVDVLLAAAGGFELTDGLWVEYQFDGGTWEELIAFRPNGTNTALSEDTDGNGFGDGAALTGTLTNYNLPILDSGNVLKVRVRARSSAGSEEIAFDELVVNGSVVSSPPVLSNFATGPLSYTEGDGPVVISSSATITDADDTEMEGATIEITSNYVNGEDLLEFTPSGGITGSFVASTGLLTLSGTASLAAYETVLKSVTYENTNLVNPSQSNRNVRFRVNDGDSSSNAVDIEIVVLDLVSVQAIPFCESFETDGRGTRYSANSFNIPPDFFERAAADFGGLSGINADGVFAFVGKDTNADGNPGHAVEIIVDTSGATDLQLDLKLAAVANQFEAADTILIERESDGGGFVTLTSFSGTGTNTSMTNGMLTLGPDYTDLNFSLPDANETRIRVTMNSSASTEEFAVDNICVTGSDLEPPVADLANPANASSVGSAAINAQGYLDVAFSDVGFSELDLATIGGDEMTLSGAGVGTVVLAGTAVDQGGGTYRYAFSGNFVPGAVTVTFPAGTFADLSGNLNVLEIEGFTVLNTPPVPGPDIVDRNPSVGCKIPGSILLANDIDPDTGTNAGLTVTGVTYTGGKGADVFLAGGTVFYNPLGYTGNDTFDYTVQDSDGGTATGTVTINATLDPGLTKNITILLQQGGAGTTVTLTAAGIPGRAYRVQAADTGAPNWFDLPGGTVVADALGRISYTDPGPLPPTRIYRVVHP